MLSKFNAQAAQDGYRRAEPYMVGVGATVLATMVDGMGAGLQWSYPKFMQDNFLGKIDWRLYGAGAAAALYFLEDDTEYASWKDNTLAVGVGLLGSWVLTSAWSGPRAWGEKLGAWVHDKTAKASVAATAGSPVLATDGKQKLSSDGKPLVYAADGKTEIVSSGFDGGEEESGAFFVDEAGNVFKSDPENKLKRLKKRLNTVQSREAAIEGKIQAIEGKPTSSKRLLPLRGGAQSQRLLAAPVPAAPAYGRGGRGLGYQRTPEGGIYIPPRSPYVRQFSA